MSPRSEVLQASDWRLADPVHSGLSPASRVTMSGHTGSVADPWCAVSFTTLALPDTALIHDATHF